MKIKSVLTISALSLLTNVYAGAMGPVSSDIGSTIIPFVTGEVAYTWNSMYPGIINNVQSTKSTQYWGGRVAGGFALKHSETLYFTGEAGWGSYGNNKFNRTSGQKATYDLHGFDILLGTVYNYKQMDFFVKAGALIENIAQIAMVNNEEYSPGGFYVGQTDASHTFTNLVPEVRVGAEYNVNSHVGVSLAYMYAFGTNQSMNLNNNSKGAILTSENQTRFQALTINSLMLGLRYYI